MAIAATFTKDDIQKRFDAFLEEVLKQQIEAFQHLGEMCVAHARSVPKKVGFEDRTGNLRSSIGYAIFVDGMAIHTAYKGRSEGIEAGSELAERVGKNTRGICLVVTAGMNYAVYVEAKGRDVLTSAEILAARELPRMRNQLTSNIKETIR